MAVRERVEREAAVTAMQRSNMELRLIKETRTRQRAEREAGTAAAARMEAETALRAGIEERIAAERAAEEAALEQARGEAARIAALTAARDAGHRSAKMQQKRIHAAQERQRTQEQRLALAAARAEAEQQQLAAEQEMLAAEAAALAAIEHARAAHEAAAQEAHARRIAAEREAAVCVLSVVDNADQAAGAGTEPAVRTAVAVITTGAAGDGVLEATAPSEPQASPPETSDDAMIEHQPQSKVAAGAGSRRRAGFLVPMIVAFAGGAMAALMIAGRSPVAAVDPAAPVADRRAATQSTAPVSAQKEPGCLCLKAATMLENPPPR